MGLFRPCPAIKSNGCRAGLPLHTATRPEGRSVSMQRFMNPSSPPIRVHSPTACVPLRAGSGSSPRPRDRARSHGRRAHQGRFVRVGERLLGIKSLRVTHCGERCMLTRRSFNQILSTELSFGSYESTAWPSGPGGPANPQILAAILVLSTRRRMPATYGKKRTEILTVVRMKEDALRDAATRRVVRTNSDYKRDERQHVEGCNPG